MCDGTTATSTTTSTDESQIHTDVDGEQAAGSSSSSTTTVEPRVAGDGPERSADDSSEEDPGLLETESGVILVTVMMILMVWMVGGHIRNRSRDGVDSSKAQKKLMMTGLQVPSRYANWLTCLSSRTILPLPAALIGTLTPPHPTVLA